MERYIHAVDLDDATLKQFDDCCKEDFVVKAALMPDAHLGYVAPIGAVLVAKDHVVPSWVGYDIGCGVSAAKLSGITVEEVKENRDAIFEKVKALVPMGKGKINSKEDITEETKKDFKELVRTFMQGPHDKNVLQFIQSKAIQHVGSLGDGNHFLELDYDNDDVWVVVHSGSRGIGFKVAERYMKKSANKRENFEATYPLALSSELGKEYVNVLNFGLDFALLNRMEMIKKAVMALKAVFNKDITYELWVNKNHNHAIPYGEYYIHRKGATPAQKGERGVIPANMRDGNYLVEGKGCKEFIESSSHGAGRAHSRTGAKNMFTLEQFKKSMEGITGTVTEGTIDEAPMAYKDINAVMDAQKESVDVVKHLKPLINWKGERKRFK